MLSKEMLDMLVCPEDHSALALADDELVARLNDAVAAGTLVNRAGTRVETRLDAGLVRADQTLLYPIVEGIPVLLRDEAIPLSQCDSPGS